MKTLASRPVTRIAVVGALLVLLALVVLVVPIAAITWGQKDTSGKYPEVGDIVYQTSTGATGGFCSGTLIHPRVFLTAGHCTAALEYYQSLGVIAHLFVSFDREPFKHGAKLYYEVDDVVTHPEYAGLKPMSDPHDLGLLILKEEVEGITPAVLPAEGFLDDLRASSLLGHGTNGAKFTVVGYGDSLSFPPPRFYSEDVRQYGFSEFRALLPAWLRMSQQGRTGDQGTCYGDSGGPTFWEDGGSRTIVATTSWGDAQCVSSEFNYRVDLPGSLAFINGVIDKTN
jgi:secreted trypsin-like serine protease